MDDAAKPSISVIAFMRSHALRAANVAVFAILGALLFRQVDLGALREAISGADLRLVGGAFALNVPVGVLFAARSNVVLLRLGHRVEGRVLVPAMILGNVAGSLTPASAGELLRAAALRSHAKIPAADGLALVAFERGLSLYLLAVGTGVGAAFVALSRSQAIGAALVSLPLFAAPALAPILLRLLPDGTHGGERSRFARMLRHTRDATDRIGFIMADRRLLLTWSAATALLFGIFTLQIWMLERSIADALDPAQVWVAFGASQLAGIASLLPLGLGAMDGSLAALLRRFGLTLDQGAATAVLFRLVVTIPYGIVALLCFLYLERPGASGRRETADASASSSA